VIMKMVIYTRVLSQDGAVGIATGYGLDNRGVGIRVPVGPITISKLSRPALGSTQPCIQWIQGYRGSFPGGKGADA
jgi:hypothetical protein